MGRRKLDGPLHRMPQPDAKHGRRRKPSRGQRGDRTENRWRHLGGEQTTGCRHNRRAECPPFGKRPKPRLRGKRWAPTAPPKKPKSSGQKTRRGPAHAASCSMKERNAGIVTHIGGRAKAR